MNFSFEGNYKPRRNINLGGIRSHEDKKTLMAKAQAERRAREHERQRQRCAVKIQSFYRAKRDASRLRRVELDALQTNLKQLTQLDDDTTIATCMRQCLILSYGPQNYGATLNDLCDILLSSSSSSSNNNLLRFMHLFGGSDKDQLDERTWLLALFTTKVILAAVTSFKDIGPLVRFVSIVMDPTTYTHMAQYNDTLNAHDTYMRISTHALLHGNITKILRQLLLHEINSVSTMDHNNQPSILTYTLDIVLDIIKCKPPYDYTPSNITKWRPAAPSTTSMFGLFSGNGPSSSSNNAASTPKLLHRPLILQHLLVDVFSIPFLVDNIPDDTLKSFLDELPLESALTTLNGMYESEEWTHEHTPERVVGLLMNMTQMGGFHKGVYLDRAIEPYSIAIQNLLSDLPSTYLNEPEEDEAMTDSDDELTVSENEDVVMTEVSRAQQQQRYVDPLVRERLKMLYDKGNVDALVKRFIDLAQTSGGVNQALAGRLAGLFDMLMTRWPLQKDPILNALLYHRWWVDGQRTEAVDLAQVFWKAWSTHEYAAVFDNDDTIMNRLSEAVSCIMDSKSPDIWAILYLLCEMYTKLLLTIGDDEFFDDNAPSSHLKLDQIVALSRQLKNISFVLFWRAGSVDVEKTLGLSGIRISQLRSTVTQLLRQIHTRDSRRAFCPKEHWLIKKLDTEGFSSEAVAEEFSLENDPEQQSRQPSKTKLALISPRLGVLNNIPFIIPFEQRVEIFRMFVQNDRQRNNIDQFIGPSVNVTIRRNHVFEDGFSQLYTRGKDLKGKVAIGFVDEFGLHEAGIDGGGVFKEFLTSLSHEAFDTNYGLFQTTPDQLLYPNPGQHATHPTQLAFFEFIGLIIGKALYEGILLDVAFAEFFLKKCLGGINYLDDLRSLDPELYNGLIAVKNFRGNVEDLSLDFTLTQDEFGKTRTVELIPGGSNIPVTNANCIQYVYRVANYRLNTQIAKQCKAFFRGLSTIIDIKWLRMFNQAELQVLLGGASVPIDLDDLRANTVYAGYTEDESTVQNFWRALSSFDNEQRMKFIKFVTSCSRPPLLGFKELRPQLCIRNAGSSDDRLPTSSTCINLLKLPRFSNYEILRQKLLYAINAEAGFDLS
ncbi:hypothetical protein LRAMOSA08126 [Lichtheimia ramosa]|uniref:HECT-type E3 ubiquitin transferase n=1 Tax=Lichtheimia ramosa TaxID=688394 RepID=A0A077WEQ3_9FUNG|nr:hypothetical protein LRAMOSA08126 [Lichtheimia ramosa]